MKEFVDKFIGRLEEKKGTYFDGWPCEGTKIKINDVIKIVKDLAEEHNTGWIPCEVRLPEDSCESVLAITKDGLFYIASCDSVYKEWYDDNFERKIEVIAWQPLPAPYRKGE